jgi:transposase
MTSALLPHVIAAAEHARLGDRGARARRLVDVGGRRCCQSRSPGAIARWSSRAAHPRTAWATPPTTAGAVRRPRLRPRQAPSAASRPGHRAVHRPPRRRPRLRLGRHRWVVERGFAWLHAFKRLRTGYEHRADIHLSLLQSACALIYLRQPPVVLKRVLSARSDKAGRASRPTRLLPTVSLSG